MIIIMTRILKKKNEELIQKSKDLLAKTISMRLGDILEFVPLLSLPSTKDLETMITQTVKFQEYHSDGNIFFGVVSAYGITHYSLTEKGIDYFENKRKSFIIKWIENNFKAKVETLDKEIETTLIESEEKAFIKALEKTKTFIGILDSRYIKADFNPFQ